MLKLLKNEIISNRELKRAVKISHLKILKVTFN